MKGRTPPPRSPTDLKAHERRLALIDGRPAAIRAWAAKWEVPLIGDDDGRLEQVIHEARMEDRAIPAVLRRASRVWLRTRKGRLQ